MNNKEIKEWYVDGHKIELVIDHDSFTVFVDHEMIKKLSKKRVVSFGLEVSFEREGNKYYLVTFNGEFRIVKNNRFIDTDKRYYSKTMEYGVLLVSILLSISMLLVRLFNIFDENGILMYVFFTSLFILVFGFGFFCQKYGLKKK